ncbi:flagellar motility protein MotE (MotC chaperone) [Azospirillum lipoferum]|uniref:KAP NTPase domain-containing protein n=1 Tax=Azospirillum lipoferum TaxID=193 RepID=A0A5A9GJI8_AZOLI|nr:MULTISPECIES: P-loop NTPase fold protein [Azospirillum]KAA0594537.1 hypothetical protein FZ942_21000 [Azospirillum lipoferum]MCP1613294.1 flagellar motility protein MotE (MotC chaperone) [Azospirillum lipoferum]MDW5531493.1 P-loop NTPase fold protein [Azospirillum sp. NL1]
MVENPVDQDRVAVTPSGSTFESAVVKMLQLIPGIRIFTYPHMSREDGDLFIEDGTPIGIPGPVNVEVKFSNLSIGFETIRRSKAQARSGKGRAAWLLIANSDYTRAARQASSGNIILWGAQEIEGLLRRFPMAADPIRSFLVNAGDTDSAPLLYRPTVSVARTDKGWMLEADAFVLPLGVGGTLTGATYRSLANDQSDEVMFDSILESAMPPEFGTNTPVVLKRKTGNVDYLILATAYGEKGIVPGEALKSILSLPNTFRRIVLPLLGAAQLSIGQVLDEFYSILNGTRLTTPLHIILVVIDRDAEAMAKRRFVGFEDARPQPVSANQPHFTNDAVDSKNARDCLGIEMEAETFARLLASRKVTLPLAIGLFGNWGSGKSFFMKLIRQRMENIAREEKESLTEAYCTNVAHITFNAWHYLDSNLWASLALRIFEGVAAELSNANPEEPSKEATRIRRALAEKIESSRRARLEAEEAIAAAEQARRACEDRVAELQQQREKVTRGLFLSDVRLIKPEVMSAITTLGLGKIDDVEKLEKSLKEGQAILASLSALIPGPIRRLPAALRFGAILLLGLIVGEAVLTWLPELAKGVFSPVSVWIATATAFTSWAVKRLASARDAVKTLSEAVTRVRKVAAGNVEANSDNAIITELREIDQEIAAKRQIAQAAEKDLAEAAARLQKMESGALVYEFLTNRSAERHYTDGTGIVSVLRQDLELLKKKLDELNVGRERRVERIVLYIDDLDRCDPARVVEVLQAVHLLLAFDLFAVVVAVDARWLERSLYVRYLPGFEKMTEDERTASEFSPQNYLEKIFQVPYHVPGMGADGFGKLIDALTPREAPQAVRRPEPVSPTDGAIGGGSPDGGGAEPGPDVPSQQTAEQRLQPSPLTFTDHEAAAMKEAAPFITTPRAAKRLVNVYALIRMQVNEDDLNRLVSPLSSDAKALVMLLAIDIGLPRAAQVLRREMRLSAHPMPELVEDIIGRCGNAQSGLRQQLKALNVLLGAIDPVPASKEFGRWLPYVDRFSFHKPEALRAAVEEATPA